MFRKNIVFFVFLAVIATNSAFSQSLSNNDKADYRNDGLILYKDAPVYNDDYTNGDRLKIGSLNILFGLGSKLQGEDMDGYLIAIIDVAGILLILSKGFLRVGGRDVQEWNSGYTYKEGAKDIHLDTDIGYWIIGGGILLGYLLPLKYHRPGANKVSQNNFPFNIEFTSAKNGEINGLKVCYNIKY